MVSPNIKLPRNIPEIDSREFSIHGFVNLFFKFSRNYKKTYLFFSRYIL